MSVSRQMEQVEVLFIKHHNKTRNLHQSLLLKEGPEPGRGFYFVRCHFLFPVHMYVHVYFYMLNCSSYSHADEDQSLLFLFRDSQLAPPTGGADGVGGAGRLCWPVPQEVNVAHDLL